MRFVSLRPRVWIQKARVTRTKGKQERLNRQMSQFMKVDLVRGITTFKKRVSQGEIQKAIESGSWANVMKTIPWERLPDDLGKAFNQMEKVSKSSTRKTIDALPRQLNKRMRLDATNPQIQRFIAKRTNALTDGISGEGRKYIQKKIMQSLGSPTSPKDLAKKIKRSIGINERQQLALDNYETSLRTKDLSETQIEKFLDKYEDRLLTARSEMIARTEIHAAQQNGQMFVWREAADQGLINREKTRKRWIVDGAPCETCEAMDGETVDLDEQFKVKYPDGSVVFMDVPGVHPHCFCMMELVHDGAGESDDD